MVPAIVVCRLSGDAAPHASGNAKGGHSFHERACYILLVVLWPPCQLSLKQRVWTLRQRLH